MNKSKPTKTLKSCILVLFAVIIGSGINSCRKDNKNITQTAIDPVVKVAKDW